MKLLDSILHGCRTHHEDVAIHVLDQAPFDILSFACVKHLSLLSLDIAEAG